jgi:hypothetical protein
VIQSSLIVLVPRRRSSRSSNLTYLIVVGVNGRTLLTSMPRCEGLPEGPCPQNVNNRTVKLSQGDLMLCPKCEAVRFPPAQATTCSDAVGGDNSHGRKAPTSTQRGAKQASKQPVTTVSTPPSAPEDTPATDFAGDAAAVDIASSDNAQEGSRTTNTSELVRLRQLVSNQQHAINILQSRLNFVLSFLGISEGDSNITAVGNLETHVAAESRTLDQLQTNGVATDLSSVEPSVSREQWNTVVSKHRHNLKSSRGTFQQSIVAAVYVDQSVKKRRETSLIITGLASKDNLSDSQLISDLCTTEFNIVPNIVSTKRLGRLHMDKVQPILGIFEGG